MRPASEVNSALELVEAELVRREVSTGLLADDDRAMNNLRITHHVLAWVMGGRADIDDQTLWLVAYLLDDPPKTDETDPRAN